MESDSAVAAILRVFIKLVAASGIPRCEIVASPSPCRIQLSLANSFVEVEIKGVVDSDGVFHQVMTPVGVFGGAVGGVGYHQSAEVKVGGCMARNHAVGS